MAERLFNKRYKLTPDYSGDQVLYSCSEDPTLESTMLIISCGITYPNPAKLVIRHSHGGYYSYLCSVLYITSGKGYIETADGTTEFTKGDTLILNVMNECVYYSDKDDPFSALWVNYSGSLMYSLHHYYKISSPVICIKADIEKNVGKIIDTIQEVYEMGKLQAYNIILHEFLDIFAKINDLQNDLQNNSISKEEELYEKIKAFIDHTNNYDLSVQDLSDRFHYSTRHIRRIFEKYSGTTPTKYILKRKVETSKILLTQNMPIQSISSFLAFCDINHFIKTFRAFENITPAQYKRKVALDKESEEAAINNNSENNY